MYYIITPTFSGHFPYIIKYLDSFCKYVEDPENVTICFIISESEEDDFKKIINPYLKKCNITICLFEDILQQFDIQYSPEELMERYGKFTFQTFKKFLSILYLKAHYSLILDSESMWINKTNMKNMFETYFQKPYITVSGISGRKWDLFTEIEIGNINQLLQTRCKQWPLENFVWFYDLTILQSLFKDYGSLLDMAEEIFWKNSGQAYQPGIFEILLYQEYVYLNASRFGYDIIYIDKEIEAVLNKKEYKAYKKSMLQKYNCAGGFAEHLSEYLTKQNWRCLADIMKEKGQNIIRCDRSQSLLVYRWQKPFMEVLQPNILAASQEHFFGINQSMHKMLFNMFGYCFRESKIKLKKYIKHFLLKILPSYKTSSDVRNDMARLGDALNWRINNIERLIAIDLERRFSAYPNVLSDYQITWHIGVQNDIIAKYGEAWFNKKKILIVDGGYGDLAVRLHMLGSDIVMTERRPECCNIANHKLAGYGRVVHLAEDKDLRNLYDFNSFDLIIDLGLFNYNEMPFINNWLDYSDRILFYINYDYVSLSNAKRTKSLPKKHKLNKKINSDSLDFEIKNAKKRKLKPDWYGRCALNYLIKNNWTFTVDDGKPLSGFLDNKKRLFLYEAVRRG